MMDEITTADGKKLRKGDMAFNYYDMKSGIVGKIDAWPQPDTMKGQDSSTPQSEWSNHWFNFIHDDGTSASLDGSRICTNEFARRKGWM
jgi:hypothetical protein